MLPINPVPVLCHFVPPALEPIPIPLCTICFDPSVKPIGHEAVKPIGRGERNSKELIHITCLKCMQVWVEKNATCPTCRVPIKISHLASFKDKVIRTIKYTTPIVIFLVITILATRILGVPFIIPFIGMANSLFSSVIIKELIAEIYSLRESEDELNLALKTFTTLCLSDVFGPNIPFNGMITVRAVQLASLGVLNYLTSSRDNEYDYEAMNYIGLPVGLLVVAKVYGVASALFLFATHAREVIQGIHSLIELTIRAGRARFAPQV